MPDAISVFGLLLPVVRVSVIAGLLLASWLALRFSRLTGEAAKQLEAAIFRVTLVGVIAARVGYVLLYWQAYQSDLPSIFFIWQPGFSPWVGVLVATVFAYWRYAKKAKYLPAMLFGFTIAALLPLAGFTATKLRLPNTTNLQVGDTVPEVTMRTLTGEQVNLSALRGKTIILNFWTTWCPPCRREMPMFDRISQAYQSQNVVMIGLNVAEKPEKVFKAVKKLGVSYPIWLEGANTNSSQNIYQKFGGVGFPTTIMIDKNGVLRQRQLGELNQATITSWIAETR